MIKMRKPSGKPRAWQLIPTKKGTKVVELPLRVYGTHIKPAQAAPASKKPRKVG